MSPAGAKYGLARRVRDERAKGVEAAYLRDRDFDFDPPDDGTMPVRDRPEDPGVLGWRWSRHAIENYLLDPEIVTRALGWDRAEYSDALVTAARTVRNYQIGRWVIGDVRRSLPPNHDLRTEPDGIAGDFGLPAALTEHATRLWALEAVADFHQRVNTVASAEAAAATWEARAAALTEAACRDTQHALTWFSGKNLLAALAPWLEGRGGLSPGGMRARLRDWVRATPAGAAAALVEWRELVVRLRQ